MTTDSPFQMLTVRVESVERISPSFVRVWFAGAGLDEFATPGHVFDQRIKLIFPGPLGLPDLADAGADWYTDWLALPEDARGAMRTYSIRAIEGTGAETRLVIDFVLHLVPGLAGPASSWANTASPGDELLVLGPRRGCVDGVGIEFCPQAAAQLLLVGDETALPAIARILGDLPRTARGDVFVEVPVDRDVVPLDVPPGVRVHWSIRSGRDHGTVVGPALLAHLGTSGGSSLGVDGAAASGGGMDGTGTGTGDMASSDALAGGNSSSGDERDNAEDDARDEAAILPWETPTYSASGEEIRTSSSPSPDRYTWIAGESSLVTSLRRHLVKGLGFDRSQVAFMGYWRKGVAMRG